MLFKKKKLITSIITIAFAVAIFLPLNVSAATPGIDIYEGDDIENWNAVKNSGITTVIQKATQGEYHNDSLLYYRYQRMMSAGLKIGFYHYADNDGGATAQAQHFLSRIKGLHSDTCLFLDIENEGDWSRWDAIDFTNTFIHYVQSQGYKIGIYTGECFYKDYLQGSIPNVPLWIANYGRQPATYPSQSWQYSIHSINGAVGNVDCDYFTDNIFLTSTPAPISVIMQQPIIIQNNRTATLQENLNNLLAWNISVDGIQGYQTRTATKQFQRMVGLTPDGIAGNQTNRVISSIMAKPLLKYGSKGKAVKFLQYRLGISNDGYFGSDTKKAVMEWQQQHGLTPDGIVGWYTWRTFIN